MTRKSTWLVLAAIILLSAACQSSAIDTNFATEPAAVIPQVEATLTILPSLSAAAPPHQHTNIPTYQYTKIPINQQTNTPTPYPDSLTYLSQPGDSLDVVARRFHVLPGQIRSSSSLPTHGLIDPGQKLFLPLPDSSSPAAHLMPDSQVVYGPSALDFDIAFYLRQAGGTLNWHEEYLSSTGWTSAADIIERVALENSINPRLLLALLEYRCGCVRGDASEKLEGGYVLGVVDYHFKGLYGQLWWAANQLSIGYYGWREGWQLEIPLPNGQFFHPAPDENAGSVALQAYFASLWNAHDQADKMGAEAWAALQPDPFDESDWQAALASEAGFMALYQAMFSDPRWSPAPAEPIYPPGLSQPALILPFEPGWLWSFASGPHPAWEKAGALAALDFAPASHVSGCQPTQAWVTAVADGPVVRVGPGLVLQDLDAPGSSDGREQTGWAILYMHIADQDKAPLGAQLRAGDLIGRPSCEGGPSTGTHLHIARKYNGEWIAAGGALPFVLDGWTAHAGGQPYQGTLTRDGKVVIAHPYGSYETHISRDAISSATPPAAFRPDP